MGYDLSKINNLFGKNRSIPMLATEDVLTHVLNTVFIHCNKVEK